MAYKRMTAQNKSKDAMRNVKSMRHPGKYKLDTGVKTTAKKSSLGGSKKVFHNNKFISGKRKSGYQAQS